VERTGAVEKPKSRVLILEALLIEGGGKREGTRQQKRKRKRKGSAGMDG